MKLTFSVVLTVALVASLGTASPLLITKQVIRKVVDKHFEPKTVTTHAVVYTPVVAPPPPPVVLAAAPAHHPAVASPSALHAKLTSTLGSLLKHPLLQHPWLAKFVPLGGVVEVVRKFKPGSVGASYPPVVQHPVPEVDLPHEVEEHHTVTTVVTTPAPVYGLPAAEPAVPAPVYGLPAAEPVVPAPVYGLPAAEPVVPAPVYGVPAPAPVVPAPVYGVPAATYGPPGTGEHSSASSSSSSSSSSSTSSSDGAAKYVAVNPGARHEAPLPGYDHSVVLENLDPAPGTEGLTMLVPPVVSNELHHWNPEPVVLRGEDMLSSDYLRMAHDVATGGADPAEPVEARYVAINNGVRHEAPLPGYDRSIVIENADTV
ncbi:pollen-specific leucine-rich repeat extensin-like protein 1 [Anopheles merus]|uniref:pollen-specific leucine-rich repeat extensin-like protein 1 n=1 Tax=Anopheles merus TaxID=30066 RepID=UPI001BE41DD7|nr:pollen-specific leucine-rich repeat extensin-like protein 1 [Anopheles merus]